MRKTVILLVFALLSAAACGQSGSTPTASTPSTPSTASTAGESTDNEATVPATTPGLTAAKTIQHCGIERWPVKTGTDVDSAKVNLTPKTTTIAALIKLPTTITANNKQPPRSQVEEQTYSTTAILTGYKAEGDSDLHLIISDHGKTMIVEIPDPACVGPGSPFTTQIYTTRKAFLQATGYKIPAASAGGNPLVSSNKPVTVTGVGFFDFIHGQTGVAPNGIELHPVLSITFG